VKDQELEEARRLLYVGMTRTEDRLVLTCVTARGGKPSGGHQFLDEMGLVPGSPGAPLAGIYDESCADLRGNDG
jgi:hypothetical protein